MSFVVIAVIALPVLWLWGRPLFTGGWRSPGWFAGTAGLCLVLTGVTWLVGALSGTSLSREKSCHAAGADYDRAYQHDHWREASRWFPLHNKCNATYDLVPAWVNPTLVALPVAAVVCAGVAVRLAVADRRTKEGTA
ncbi:hypothetical protein [Streptantibioticus cattleyicolor]|uniref:Uncharacterized protein n=1 Tax=Streptantibioticus cattleyicolor (strain ATCC 35852 / DSM 46488 / JCM 4925 / NBRC 14057 / NRRL 8057) TaxID=1003195 RepID=F8JN26_STREN|nr:hypothetical protein [Streptantibioticus cattleyicolor]AEW99223.1 hypothetical protein SCATT_p10300 [Streptantibioticus cattleyicolor NRRL 8057 = DSM 46488]CCB71734.1 conserved membrane protein of unknown function [Streptantibioticus cattleyicolor NRRL 8057 = DSM 46488]